MRQNEIDNHLKPNNLDPIDLDYPLEHEGKLEYISIYK